MKIVFSTLLFSTCLNSYCQQSNSEKSQADTILPLKTIKNGNKFQETDKDIPVIALTESELIAKNDFTASLLTAGRDPFLSVAGYNFNPVRYKVRSYEADQFRTSINGIPMENLDQAATPFALWGGLNDVLRNGDISIGLRANSFSFGRLGSVTNLDTRAGKQRKQTIIGYTFSDRSFTHKFSVTYNTGYTKKGWAFSISGSRRWAGEGYVPGTFYDGWSYFFAADKRFGQRQLISLTVLGAPLISGRSGAVTAEATELTNNPFYNPYWGYQNGKKRNANTVSTHQPLIIFTHEYKISNQSNLLTAIGYSFGERASGSLDWYNAADPRPDTYRYLPSYYKNNAYLSQKVELQWRKNDSIRQINWTKLYAANTSAKETFNGVNGFRSHYITADAVNQTRKLVFNTVYNAVIGKNANLTAGLSYQWQQNNFYKRITDLLGGNYFADLNQFAERSFPNNADAAQADLNHSNHVVYKGDRYQYDYLMQTSKAGSWIQTEIKLRKFDVFAALEFSNTQYRRTGNMRNGLFRDQSYGPGTAHSFNNYAIKAGVTYKMNGRNYGYLNGTMFTAPPYANHVYNSPRTRDQVQNSITSEQVFSVEGGYVLNAPFIRLRATGYYTSFRHQMNVFSFYHDAYQNLVNYSLSNIDKELFGLETGIEVKLLPGLTLNGAASIGRNYYHSNPLATVTQDNNAGILSADTVYAKGYKAGGSPQEAVSLGFGYRSPKYWFVSVSINYFGGRWLDINPVRRTYKAVENTIAGSPERNAILEQQALQIQYTADLFAGYSWKLPRKWSIHKKQTFLVFYASISNILNNRQIISGGYEQLRFDFTSGDVKKFPPKYSYAYGLNYSFNTSLRF